jgi:hypothetical protein
MQEELQFKIALGNREMLSGCLTSQALEHY